MAVFPSRRAGFTAFVLFLLSALSLSPAAAQVASQPPPPPAAPALQTGIFYYANGSQIPLVVATDVIAVDFGGAAGAITFDAPGMSAVQAASATQPGLIAGYDFYLLPLQGVGTAEGAVSLVESMRASMPVEWANPVYRLDQFTMILTDQFIAGFPTGTPRSTVDEYNASNGVTLLYELSPDVYVLQTSGVDALTMANRYEEGGVARYGYPNWITIQPRPRDTIETVAEPLGTAGERMFMPNDPFFAAQWHLNNTAQFAGATADADIDAPEAWDITQGSNTVIVAILDSGVQMNHPDLDAKLVFPYDPVGGDFDPGPYDSAFTREFDGHGTAVAGLAAAETNNSMGIAGVCPNCRIIPIRIYYTINAAGDVFTSDATSIQSVNWARTNGAAIINNSFFTPPTTGLTEAYVNAALNGRGGLGTVIVSAAGNFYPNAFSIYPGRLSAAYPGMITVGGSTWCDLPKTPNPPINDCSGDPAWGANRGTEIGISAPAHAIGTTDLTGDDGYVSSAEVANPDYVVVGGTSMATGIASGIAGLVLTANPTFTSDQVRDRILTTADPIAPAGYDNATGWGRVNAQKALANTVTNTGTVNDHRSGATVMNTNTFFWENIQGAFVDETDPVLSCLPTSEVYTSSIWFRYTPASIIHVSINTFSSNVDTVLAVFNAAMTPIGCNDDASFPDWESLLSLDLTGGAQYWIMIGRVIPAVDPYGPPLDAIMQINIVQGTTLTGQVTLQGRPTAPHTEWSVPLRVIVKPSGGGAAVFDGTTYTNYTGGFIITGIPAGNYTVWVKHGHTLARSAALNLNSDVTHNFTTLLEGDADNSNSVILTDFSILAGTFGKALGAGGYDARADFNGDDVVNLTDFSLLASNFGQAGAPAP